eukprot:1061372-Pyramimonas_sp.AAC.1
MNPDAGGDIAKCRKRVQAEVAEDPGKVFIGVDCMMHQYHLMVRSDLGVIEHAAIEVFGLDPGYGSRLASIMVLWQDKARSVHSELVGLHAGSAMAATKLPPRALVGRWGSVSACE